MEGDYYQLCVGIQPGIPRVRRYLTATSTRHEVDSFNVEYDPTNVESIGNGESNMECHR